MLIPIVGFTQQKDTLIKKLDSLSKKKDSAGGQIIDINPKAYNERTKLTFNSYFILLASDLQHEFTKPFHMTRRDWRNFGKFAVVTVALGFADEPIQRFGMRLRSKDTAFQKVSKFITRFGGTYEAYALIGLGAYGFIFKDEKIKIVTFLATQAYITGAALEKVLKFVTGRTRPSFYDANTEAEPKFLGPFSTKKDLNGKECARFISFGPYHGSFCRCNRFCKGIQEQANSTDHCIYISNINRFKQDNRKQALGY